MKLVILPNWSNFKQRYIITQTNQRGWPVDILDDLLDAIQEAIIDCEVAYEMKGKDLEQEISAAHRDLNDAKCKIAQIKQNQAD